jgi:hypothetical protein
MSSIHFNGNNPHAKSPLSNYTDSTTKLFDKNVDLDYKKTTNNNELSLSLLKIQKLSSFNSSSSSHSINNRLKNNNNNNENEFTSSYHLHHHKKNNNTIDI